ncbi:MAG TPA: hypothetical protein VNT57_02530, partial [Desulfobacteria bacterium]|nr:hypothetical protein [Desulfobacteria bacterium]
MGYLLTEVIGQWIWLDMRFNIALIIPVLTLAGFLTGLSKKPALGTRCVTSLEVLWFLVTILIYWDDLSALTIIPAVLLREGFGIDSLSLSEVNILLLFVLISAN